MSTPKRRRENSEKIKMKVKTKNETYWHSMFFLLPRVKQKIIAQETEMAKKDGVKKEIQALRTVCQLKFINGYF